MRLLRFRLPRFSVQTLVVAVAALCVALAMARSTFGLIMLIGVAGAMSPFILYWLLAGHDVSGR
jgi:hypothetical protein